MQSTSRLTSHRQGDVRWLVGDVLAIEARFAAAAESAEPPTRLVSISLDVLPPLSTLLDELVAALAEAALVLWPEWYGGVVDAQGRLSGGRPCPDLLPNWLRNAALACRRGRRPTLPKFTPTIQARQLAAALSPGALHLVLSVHDPAPSEERLAALAAGAEWIAETTHAATTIIATDAIAQSPAVQRWPIERVDFLDESASNRIDDDSTSESNDSGAKQPPSATGCESRDEASLEAVSQAHLARDGQRETSGIESTAGEPRVRRAEQNPPGVVIPARRRVERPKVVVAPVLGRPHPQSQGEQLLAARLADDAELRELFGFNLPLQPRGDRYIVDLLWAAGRVVVEVDGFYWHSNEYQFALDRRRDFELTIAGYVVLRLPHDEVLSDVSEAIEKIRAMVRFRRRHPYREDAAT